MKNWELVKIRFQQHALCVVVMLLIILIALIVVLRGEEKDLVSHVSLACALAGGLLAVIVIVYTLIDSADVRTNLTEMRMLMAEVRGDVGKTASAVDQMREAQDMFSSDMTSRFVHPDTEHEIQYSQPDSFSFKLSEISAFNLCAYYCAVKSFRKNIAFVVADVVKYMFSEEDNIGNFTAFVHGFSGMLVTLKGLVSAKQIVITLSEPTKIKHIPSELCDSVEYQINQRIENATPEKKGKLKGWKKGVDDYFAAS